MDTQPILNYDILLEVMKACSMPDCARFMRTARFFRDHGAKTLLSHPQSLRRDAHLVQFINYLRMQGTNHFQFVRSLSFDVQDLTKATAEKLARAFSSMSALEDLRIMYSEDFIRSHPDLSNAICHLTSLRRLRLIYAGDYTLNMLLFLRSKLTSIYLDVSFGVDYAYGEAFDDGRHLFHPAILLAHSKSTLEEISIQRWFRIPGTPPPPSKALPNVRRLTLARPHSPARATSYIVAYPNLTHLHFDTASTIETYGVDGMDTFRARNILEQRDEGPTWKSLDRLKGCLPDLYVLGLTCTIEHLEVTRHLSGVYLYMLGPVLSFARPRHLTLPTWPSEKLHDPTSDLFACFRGPGSSRLEMLDMKGDLEKSDSDLDVAAVLEGLFSALAAGAPLQELRVEIKLSRVDPRPRRCWRRDCPPFSLGWQHGDPIRPLPDLEEHPLNAAEESVVNFDARGYVQRFTAAVPTLRQLSIHFFGPRWRHRTVTLVDAEVQIDGSW
ncbi:uncharacterized protein TRAVEDRAFT_43763 [Trametes versicolor FP-101664 SS1]|uniref:uncharacterized protein n=1 Tax=Trametes versicolor (strain FP-101664) TaxID=717944 RepID=UPI0004621E70|nr:uncharacterized protein TRAVEDRAFT_43763 [Trametes versicolor FP-101664 SS1]EIW63470.1 hypothetical protein TRAVEDRAFT_43763 [Trametes versicolor FP-101664 SS1]